MARETWSAGLSGLSVVEKGNFVWWNTVIFQTASTQLSMSMEKQLRNPAAGSPGWLANTIQQVGSWCASLSIDQKGGWSSSPHIGSSCRD